MVPSLSLMSQTIREWKNDSKFPFNAFSACSDKKVGKKKNNDDFVEFDLNQLAFPATTDAEKLAEQGISVSVVDMHTLKPLDTNLIQSLVEKCGVIVTAEDHSIIGGLGGAVAEYLSSNCPAPLERVGVNDRFGESGQPDEMLNLLGISSEHIEMAVKKAQSRK